MVELSNSIGPLKTSRVLLTKPYAGSVLCSESTDTRQSGPECSSVGSGLQRASDKKPDITVTGGLAGWQIERVRRHIHDNITARLPIVVLGRLIRLSPAHFSKAFKRSFGRSPHRYIVEVRVAHAKELLVSSDASVCEIAVTCGFSDQSHMSRRFRRATGLSPAAWRLLRRAMSVQEDNLRCDRRVG